MTDQEKGLRKAIEEYKAQSGPILDQLEAMIRRDIAHLSESDQQDILNEIARNHKFK